MDELVFLLILAGIGVVLLVAMFTYYTHHKKINDEIKSFNDHVYSLDDVLLDETNHSEKNNSSQDSSIQNGTSSDAISTNNMPSDGLLNDELPGSFSASRQEHFDIDAVQLKHDSYSSDAVSSASTISPQSALTEASTTTTPVEKAPVNERELIDGVYIHSKRIISDTAAPQKTDKAVIADKPPASTFSQASNQNIIKQKSSGSGQTIKVVYDPVPDGVEELIISHTILSKGEPFKGTSLFQALGSAGLLYGEMNIFHYPGDDKKETFALFSVANIVEPGTFDPQTAESLLTPGITLFMRLPARKDNYTAYEEFIRVAQKVTAELGGELCDETRSQLTQQVISYKKEQIRKLNFALVKAEKIAGTKR